MGGKAPDSEAEDAAWIEMQSNLRQARDATYADRPNQYGPLGSVEWVPYTDIDPATGETVTRWTQQTTLSPEMQSVYSGNINYANAATQTGIWGYNNLMNQGPVNVNQFGSTNPYQYQVAPPGAQLTPTMYGAGQTANMNPAQFGATNPAQFNTTPYGQMSATMFGSGQYAPLTPQQFGSTNPNDFNIPVFADQINPTMYGTGSFTPIDPYFTEFGEAPELEYTNDELRQQAYDYAYAHDTSRLDPQFEAEALQLDIKLRNQGLQPGDQAYDAQMDTFYRGRTDAYEQARNYAFEASRAEADMYYQHQMGAAQYEAAQRQAMMDAYMQAQTFNLTQEEMIRQYNTNMAYQQNQMMYDQTYGSQNAAFNMEMAARQQQIDSYMQAEMFNQQMAEQARQYNTSTQMGMQNQAYNQSYMSNQQAYDMEMMARQQQIDSYMNAYAFNAQQNEAIRQYNTTMHTAQQDQFYQQQLAAQQMNYNMEMMARQQQIDSYLGGRQQTLAESQAADPIGAAGGIVSTYGA